MMDVTGLAGWSAGGIVAGEAVLRCAAMGCGKEQSSVTTQTQWVGTDAARSAQSKTDTLARGHGDIQGAGDRETHVQRRFVERE